VLNSANAELFSSSSFPRDFHHLLP